MRSNTEQVRRSVDTSTAVLEPAAPVCPPSCARCAQALVAIGWFDMWLLFACAKCSLVWRMTARELVESGEAAAEATDPSTPHEAC